MPDDAPGIRVCAIVVAAGNSSRMGGIDKLFAELLGRPLLYWTLAAFRRCKVIDDVIVVSSRPNLERVDALVREWNLSTKVRATVPGGETRQDSVRAGIDASTRPDIVVIHDGARPLVTPDLIERGVALARATGAALCAVPARDTVKVADGEPPLVSATLSRETVWLAQTPQCFDRELLLRAHGMAEGQATDDAALVEAIGAPVTIYEGSTSNIKVTTPEDLLLAEALMRERFAHLE